MTQSGSSGPSRPRRPWSGGCGPSPSTSPRGTALRAASVPEVTLDVRVGGHRRVCMQVGAGDTARRMWFGGEFLEVVEHERLVYTDSMTDEHGRVLSPADLGLPPGHPATTEVHVDLADLGGGRTRVVMTHIGVPEGRRAPPDGTRRSTGSRRVSRPSAGPSNRRAAMIGAVQVVWLRTRRSRARRLVRRRRARTAVPRPGRSRPRWSP